MGGGISATSELGQGSCFTIRVLAWMAALAPGDEVPGDTAVRLAN
jgi:hypothetical protein